MKTISSLVESVLRRFTSSNIDELNYNLSSNLELRLFSSIDPSKPFKLAKKEFLKNYLGDLLTLSLGNISIAAKKAGLHRRHLHRIINDLEIDSAIYRRELTKPSLYIKDSIHGIVEGTFASFGDMQSLRELYSNLDDISEFLSKNIDTQLSYEEALELFEKEFIEKALKDNNNDVQKTAETIDLSERTLYRKIGKLNIAVA